MELFFFFPFWIIPENTISYLNESAYSGFGFRISSIIMSSGWSSFNGLFDWLIESLNAAAHSSIHSSTGISPAK